MDPPAVSPHRQNRARSLARSLFHVRIHALTQQVCACTGAEKDADIALASNDGEQYGEGEIWVCPSLFGAEAGNDVLRMLIDGLPAQVVLESRVQGS